MELKTLNLRIPVETMNELVSSARDSGRPLAREALIRLQDHLLRFESIAKIGDIRNSINVIPEEKI